MTAVPLSSPFARNPGDLPELGCVRARTTACVEVSLILPGWQLEALEREAAGRGVTTGQLLRRIIGDTLL